MSEGYNGGPLMNPLARIQEKEKIALVDHYSQTPLKIAADLDNLLELLGENESHIFRCTCEEYDPPRGMMDYDCNSYEHHRDCPSGSMYHYEVLLRGLARYFREDVTS